MYDKKASDALNHTCNVPVEGVVDGITPECTLVGEDEEQAREKAIYHGKKLMTNMERKVFNRYTKGLTEETIANQLHITQQRVNKLKQKAFAKVQKLYDEWRN
jgi:DNA-directed RNA polymerase specialized sigma subunit